MASLPELSFGDFSKEECDCYFKGHSCVELPPVFEEIGDLIQNSENGSTLDHKLCFFNGPLLSDENQNTIINQLNESDEHVLKVSTTPHTTTVQNSCQLPNGVATQPEQKQYENEKVDSPEATETIIPMETKEPPMVNGHISDNENTGSTQDDKDGTVNGQIDQHEVESPDKTEPAVDLPVDSPKQENVAIASSPPAAKEKSWASLFSGATGQTTKQSKPVNASKSERTAPVQSTTVSKENSQSKRKQPGGVVMNGSHSRSPPTTEVVDVAEDPFSRQIADQIAKNEIVYKSPGLMPRGFINSSNWCYINATLQALLTSSPFCHLMRSLPSRQPSADTSVILTSTPVLDSFIRLVKELKPLPKKGFQRAGKEQFQGTSYEPDYIYKMLSTIKSKFSEKGRQEDAEEFLSCVLNGLHEEMLKVCEYYFGKNSPQQDDSTKNSQTELGYEVPVHEDEQGDESNEEEDQWEEVTATRKNRSSVMRRADISKTPVSDVFRGELRSDLFQEGLRGTATLEPFFTLPLDINDQKAKWSVNEALDHLTRLETVQDFTNTKTKTKGEATRRISLETLPPVLILHLKRFIYDKEGGSLKIDKEVQYHTDLVIGKELLSKSSKKLSQEKRTYKLFAVVYHHGKAVTGGHYTTDVYHDGLNCWLRIDDQHIKMSKVHEVVRHDPQRTAYLLYYKRTDLMAV